MEKYNKVIKDIKSALTIIVNDHLTTLKKGDYEVSIGYGYNYFTLDKVDGSYDKSLQSLIHYIMIDDDLYKEFLNEEQMSQLNEMINNEPYGIYRPDEDDDDNDVNETLDTIYDYCIKHVIKEFKNNRIKINEELQEYN